MYKRKLKNESQLVWFVLSRFRNQSSNFVFSLPLGFGKKKEKEMFGGCNTTVAMTLPTAD